MKKFKFRLERVNQAYDIKEQQSKRLFAEASRERDLEQEKLEKVRMEIANEDEKLKHQTSGDFEAGEALLQHRFTEKLRTDSLDIIISLEDKEEKVRTRRIELTEAMQNKQLLDTLRKKRFEEHQKQTQRIEQIELDDLAARKFNK